MNIVIEQVLVLFVFAAVGFILAKSGTVKQDHSILLSKLLVNVFLPAGIFKTFAKYCTISYISEHYILICVSLVILLVFAVLFYFLAKTFTKDKRERGIFEYTLVIPNFSYMGYTFAEALFGSMGLMNAIMFSLPLSFYTYTYGYCILSNKKLSFKNLINPIMFSLVFGGLAGITELGNLLPQTFFSFLDRASACMAPVSMLLMGIVVSEFGLKKILKDRRVYIVSVLRLLAIPCILGFILKLFGNTAILENAMLMYCMPCGLNTIIFVKNSSGNCETGAGFALVSNVLSVLSIPLVLMLFGVG